MKNKFFVYVLCAATVIITSVISYSRVNGVNIFHGDTGQLYIILQNLKDGNGAYNPIQPSLNEFTARGLTHLAADKICEQDLTPEKYTANLTNHFRFHSYFILYPLSFLLYLFESPSVIHWFNILSFISVLAISAYLLRRQNFKIRELLIPLCLIMLYPGWSWSIQGQPYVDRLYMPVSMILFYILNNEKKISAKLILITALSCLIAEKTIIYNAIFFITFLILYFKDINNRNKIFFIILILMLVSTSYYLTNFYINNLYYSTAIPKSIDSIIGLFKSENFKNGTASLIIISVPLLIPPLLHQRKLFVLALVMLMPNIFGNIGGAEKIGFSTHYHALYFGFIIYAFITALKQFINNNKFIGTIFMLITCIFYGAVGFDSDSKIKISNFSNSNFISRFYNEYKSTYDKSGEYFIIQDHIPINSRVSTTETGMPYLYKYKNLDFYPLNIGKVDFIVLNYYTQNNHIFYNGYYGHINNTHNSEVDACLFEKYKKIYDFENPILINNYLAIIKRNL
jgi:hypothetical protein